jgi:RimJ/RimL family protein N-acetyltransferase
MKKLMIDYAFESLEDVIFYIGKENIRSQKAVEKIGGARINESKYQHLIKKSDKDFTYRINKNDWEN